MLSRVSSCLGCSGVAQDAQELLRRVHRACSGEAQEMLRGCSGDVQKMLRGCSGDAQEGQEMLRLLKAMLR